MPDHHSGWNVFNQRCPTRVVLDRLADKWTVMVALRLSKQTLRFGELRRQVGGISQKMLTQTLRGLERDGLVLRTIHAEVPPRVEYSLTALGHTLVPILEQIRAWAEGNIESVLSAQQVFDRAVAQPPQPVTGAMIVRLVSRARPAAR